MPGRPSIPRVLAAVLLHIALGLCSPATADADPDYRAWITSMKAAERGPFSRIRWFCKDGTLLPPEPFACKDHGGGNQHAEWSEQTVALHGAGYRIATFYADLDSAALLESPSIRDDLAQMLVEQFLIRVDDGWILRRARFYRGAFQAEGEWDGARRLLLTLAASNDWLTGRFLPSRTVAELVPHGKETPTAHRIRQLALSLSERDPGFMTLRNKIHSMPTQGDAELVRAYAAKVSDPRLAEEFKLLAGEIDRMHDSDPGTALADLMAKLPASAEFTKRLRGLAPGLVSGSTPAVRFAASAAFLRELRDVLSIAGTPEARLQALDVSLVIEAEHFAAATSVRAQVEGMSRRQRLDLLGQTADALYGVGLLSRRQLDALHASIGHMGAGNPDLDLYRRELRYLSLAADWAAQHLNFHFATGMEKLAELEPLALMFNQDQLRGSPLLLYSTVVDSLVRDGNRLAGVRTQLFGKEIGAGVRAVNPGLAQGILRDGRKLRAEQFRSDGIYLLPETTAELTPVAGIITAGEGNALSHVQILARSLGIPNAAVDESLLDALMPQVDKPAVLAVSPGGTVALMAENATIAPVLRKQKESAAQFINLDLTRLDLKFRELVDLSRLHSADSGRIVGPKAAHLGELKRHFPAEVTEGIAIPFGIFRQLLERPSPDGTTPMFEWMAGNYRRIGKLPAGGEQHAAETEKLRNAIHEWISGARLDEEFRNALRKRLEQRFGADGSYGVFVRSDTNVEDLPDFTGAGLNLTLPNVVGLENICTAIQQVWASPFSARAFAWRQSRMTQPEHVYPAILLLKAADVEKSGVLVTADLDTGDRDWLSVAINEGVGGAVDNQAAESLRISLRSDEVRLMSQASAPFRRRLDPSGGVVSLPASGTEYVLRDQEIDDLRRFSETLGRKFPAIVDASGQATPADVEFGFAVGKLHLFQVRPFLENPAAAGSEYLRSLDPDAAKMRQATVDLGGIPK
ncbi:MAG: hypothetical protein A3H91_12905 [Gammaproteobacteria bacterium RIFCSPLOWO2_02_FULL_61_13]|nr:MAG: hypothetical protein A3H91_12905 [Gammaproteobacteria bacterium RIFCSPLOWO2_02_FULL_61_13]